MTTSELVNKIDPSVPLGGLSLESVESAEWDVLETESFRNGESYITRKRCARINGILMHPMMSVQDTRKWLNLFPRVGVMIPESQDEALDRAKSGNNTRAVEVINLQGVPYSIPKGLSVQVPSPVAEIVYQMAEPFRTSAMLGSLNDPAYTPMEQ